MYTIIGKSHNVQNKFLYEIEHTKRLMLIGLMQQNRDMFNWLAYDQ